MAIQKPKNSTFPISARICEAQTSWWLFTIGLHESDLKKFPKIMMFLAINRTLIFILGIVPFPSCWFGISIFVTFL